MMIFKKLGWFFKAEKKSYLAGVLGLLLVALVHLIPPIIIGRVIDEIDGKTITPTKIFQYLAILLLVATAEYAFRYVWRINIWGGAFKLEKIMRGKLFSHFLKMDTACPF
jgi:ABC-type multidrug transport system fused ATPase/permease subunit